MTNTAYKTGADTYSVAIESADNYTRWIIDTFQPWFGRHLLEVGLGHGGYRRFLPLGTDYVGADIDAGSVQRARQRHADGHYVVADITDANFVSRLPAGGVDSVLCVNVLEHIERDADAVRNLLGALKPGGHLLILVPAFNQLYSDLDRMAGHLRRYTAADIPRLVGTEAETIRVHYFNAVGGIGWWMNKALRHNSLNDKAVNGQIALFDRYAVPVARILDPLARRWFGQSLVCVVRKA
jgi:SAM-dependent methyltransferase